MTSLAESQRLFFKHVPVKERMCIFLQLGIIPCLPIKEIPFSWEINFVKRIELLDKVSQFEAMIYPFCPRVINYISID